MSFCHFAGAAAGKKHSARRHRRRNKTGADYYRGLALTEDSECKVVGLVKRHKAQLPQTDRASTRMSDYIVYSQSLHVCKITNIIWNMKYVAEKDLHVATREWPWRQIKVTHWNCRCSIEGASFYHCSAVGLMNCVLHGVWDHIMTFTFTDSGNL